MYRTKMEYETALDDNNQAYQAKIYMVENHSSFPDYTLQSCTIGQQTQSLIREQGTKKRNRSKNITTKKVI